MHINCTEKSFIVIFFIFKDKKTKKEHAGTNLPEDKMGNNDITQHNDCKTVMYT